MKPYKTNKTMSNKNMLTDFSLGGTAFDFLRGLSQQAVVHDDFAMGFSLGIYRDRVLHTGQLYRLVEGRILLITSGTACCQLNLEDYQLEKGDIVVITPENIISLRSCSDDFNLIGIAFNDSMPFRRNILLHATADEWAEVMGMVNSLWRVAHHRPFRRETVGALITAIVSNVQDISREEAEQQATGKETRQELLFRQFKKLVNEHCTAERSIPFYAGRLFVSPHHLSAVVSKVSGKSVMYWINRATVLQAKVLLKNKELLVYEVAERLGFPSQSAFGAFFRRETGMTPGQYRRQ